MVTGIIKNFLTECRGHTPRLPLTHTTMLLTLFASGAFAQSHDTELSLRLQRPDNKPATGTIQIIGQDTTIKDDHYNGSKTYTLAPAPPSSPASTTSRQRKSTRRRHGRTPSKASSTSTPETRNDHEGPSSSTPPTAYAPAPSTSTTGSATRPSTRRPDSSSSAT